ncbi:hypothetical protein [Jiulongibacter sp. NS-SX5]|uniref:hypothetical protein n=1 Tax=Jiulongibacter sp. NS-SX5 TaxID=3463854 RepID=UPI004058F079
MVVLENIIIIAVFGGALGYLIKKGSERFISKNAASEGCSSCGSSGGCSTHIPDFDQIKSSES